MCKRFLKEELSVCVNAKFAANNMIKTNGFKGWIFTFQCKNQAENVVSVKIGLDTHQRLVHFSLVQQAG